MGLSFGPLASLKGSEPSWAPVLKVVCTGIVMGS